MAHDTQPTDNNTSLPIDSPVPSSMNGPTSETTEPHQLIDESMQQEYESIVDELREKKLEELKQANANADNETLQRLLDEYVHGLTEQSSFTPQTPSLIREANELFLKKFNIPWDPRRLKKIYANPMEDPGVQRIEDEILRRINADPDIQNATNLKQKNMSNLWQQARSRYGQKIWREFVEINPDKAKIYAPRLPLLQNIINPRHNDDSTSKPILSNSATTVNTFLHSQPEVPDTEENSQEDTFIQPINNGDFENVVSQEPYSQVLGDTRTHIPSVPTPPIKLGMPQLFNGPGGRTLKIINQVTNTVPQVRLLKIIIISIVILLLILVFVLASNQSLEDDYNDEVVPSPAPVSGGDTPTANPIPGLTLQKSAGASVNNGDTIIYTITAIYSGTLDVTIIDNIPANTEYRDATGVKTVDNTNGQVLWHLKDNTPSHTNESQGEDIYTFTLTVHPLKNDITVENQAFATAPGGATTGPAPATSDVETLMKGQARNTTVLGDEDSFVSAVYSHLQNRLTDGTQAQYETALHKIYQKTVAHNVNPAIFVAIWGVEASLTFNNTEFGCKPFGSGFDEQLRCGVDDAFGRMLDQFDRLAAQNGLPVPYSDGGPSCNYWDGFMYAYEAYTPICTLDDSNDESRQNFVIYYKLAVYGTQ